jgi:hypothetical protein
VTGVASLPWDPVAVAAVLLLVGETYDAMTKSELLTQVVAAHISKNSSYIGGRRCCV